MHTSPVMKYDVARQALTEAKSLREVKVISDKMTALKEYARRAKDKDLEIMAAEMRLRAERKFGELSLQLETGQGARTDRTSSKTGTKLKTETLRSLGVSKQHANRCEKLAVQNRDEGVFEAKIAATIERIRNPPKRKAPKKVDLETTRRMLERKTEINAKRAAYERRVEIAECVFSACREIEKVHCTPQEWLNELSEGHLEDVPEKVLPIIDWLNEARRLYERRRGQEPVASVDKEGGPKLQIVGG